MVVHLDLIIERSNIATASTHRNELYGFYDAWLNVVLKRRRLSSDDLLS